MRPPRDPAWADPEDQYLHDPARPSAAEIARIWAMPPRRIQRMSCKNRWSERRATYWRESTERLASARIEQATRIEPVPVEQIQSRRDQHLLALRGIIGVAARKLADSGLTSVDLLRCANSIKIAVELERDILGLQPQAEPDGAGADDGEADADRVLEAARRALEGE